MRSLLIAIVVGIGLFVFYRHTFGDPLVDLLLATNATKINAHPVWTDHWYETSIGGDYRYNVFTSDRVHYTVGENSYRTAGLSKDWVWNVGDDPIIVEIEHSHWLPGFSRIKGSGSQNLSEWFYSNVAVYIWLTAAFVVACSIRDKRVSP
ncbi:MAG: hypothetical protein HKN43_13240 [Rhodothermales bacterium]|nr:hypothetical protein [Rhodothermales bacterium]